MITKAALDDKALARYMTGGALVGGGSSALLHFVREMRKMKLDSDKAQKSEDDDPNTLVINIPKRAEVSGGGACTSVKDTESQDVSVKFKGDKEDNKRRDANKMTFKPFKKKSSIQGWPNMAIGATAAIGIGIGAAALVNKLVEHMRMKELKAEVEAAKQEYMGNLEGTSKTAQAFDAMLSSAADGNMKSAETKSAAALIDYPMTALALLGILGTGATAYVTKKILDERFNKVEQKGQDELKPSVKRIVIRSVPARAEQLPSDEKIASAEDLEVIEAQLCVAMDALSAKPSLVKWAQANLDPRTDFKRMFDFAPQHVESLRGYLESDPEVRSKLIKYMMGKHPGYKYLKWTMDVPGLKRLGDKQFWGKFDEMTYPGNVRHALKYEKLVNSTPPKNFADLADRVPDYLRDPMEVTASDDSWLGKMAQLITPGNMMAAGVVGKLLSGNPEQAVVENIITTPEVMKELQTNDIEKAEQKETKRRAKAQADAKNIQVVAEDPEAQEYLDAKREKIMHVLSDMAGEGKL